MTNDIVVPSNEYLRRCRAAFTACAWATCLLACFVVAAEAETITCSIDDWCPYTCIDSSAEGDDAAFSGYYYDILKAVYEPMGYSLELSVRPWKRALAETRAGALDCLLSPTRDEAPELIFPQEEIGCLQWCFYTAADSDWTFDGVDSLAGHILGYLAGNVISQPVNDYIAHHATDPSRVQPVYGLNFLEQNIRKLRAGRITVMVEESTVMDYRINAQGLESAIRKAGCLDCRPMYPAFSPAAPNARTYAEIFTEGMLYLRETGKLDAILSRYGLEDWRTAGPTSE